MRVPAAPQELFRAFLEKSAVRSTERSSNSNHGFFRKLHLFMGLKLRDARKRTGLCVRKNPVKGNEAVTLSRAGQQDCRGLALRV